MTAGADRRAELARALEAVHARIGRACAGAGRAAEEVELVAVTKSHPAGDVALLADLGQRLFGENRTQEAAGKVAGLADLRPAARPRWHLVGRLQRNKARSVVRWASRVESVDSARLADALDAEVARARDLGERSGPLSVLVQVSLDDAPGRGGTPVAGLDALAEHVAARTNLRMDGLMAVAPLGADPEPAFAALAEVAARFRAEFPAASVISAGMSGDLEQAIRYGSTCVRVGTALLGDRRLASR
jgi:pyridoxal phosphate enzyme (YggS family)